MAIRFTGKKAAANPGWVCKDGPWPCSSTGPRGRGPDGKWWDQCQACVDRMMTCIRNFQNKNRGPLWFLKSNKETKTP